MPVSLLRKGPGLRGLKPAVCADRGSTIQIPQWEQRATPGQPQEPRESRARTAAMPTTIPGIWSMLGREGGPEPNPSTCHLEAPFSPTMTLTRLLSRDRAVLSV